MPAAATRNAKNAERHAVLVALHDLNLNSRIMKQAGTLHEAGYRVTLVGIVRSRDDLLEEHRDFGRILRIRTAKRLHTERVAAADQGHAPADAKPFATPMLGPLRNFLGRMRENLRLSRAVVDEHPDVVISQDLGALPAAWRAGRRLKVPVIYDMIDIVTSPDTAGAPLLVGLWRVTERHLIRRVSAVICVSPRSAAWVESERRPKAAPVVVYNGPYACQGDAQPVHEPVRLLFQGHFAVNRRLDELIAAMASLRGRATLTLQGFGELRSQLEAQVEQSGLEDTVRFVDACPPEDVVREAAQYDVGVINYPGSTENLRRTIPNKLLDYLAAGLAVLASDLPALRDIVEAHECGMLFEPTGPDAIVVAAERMLADPVRLENMKRRALAACPLYAWPAQGAKFLELVDSVVAGRNPQ